jgi:hypothetical protein
VNNLKQIIEVTGAPGSGKTTFIEDNFSGHYVLLGGMPLSYGTLKRILGSIFTVIYALATGSISSRQLLWLVKKSATYEETLIARVNALRNGLMKFGYRIFRNEETTTIVDEGVSHIPFILGLHDKDIDEFLKLFHQQLTEVHIIFVTAPLEDMLRRRLLTRGHKRIRSNQAVDGFIDRNIAIAQKYVRALHETGLDVTIR